MFTKLYRQIFLKASGKQMTMGTLFLINLSRKWKNRLERLEASMCLWKCVHTHIPSKVVPHCHILQAQSRHKQLSRAVVLWCLLCVLFVS